MPVVIKSGRLKYKDSQGEYVGIDAIADKTTAQKVAEITAAGTTQLAAVNGAGATQTAAVNNAGAAQVQAVQTKGTEVLESIPDEYEELSENVVALQSAINTIEEVITDNFDETKTVTATHTSGFTIEDYGTAYSGSSNYEGFYISVNEGDIIEWTCNKVSSNPYVKLTFCETIPAANASATFIEVQKITSDPIVFHYKATNDGYLCITFWKLQVSASTISIKKSTIGYVSETLRDVVGEIVSLAPQKISGLNLVLNATKYNSQSGYETFHIPVKANYDYKWETTPVSGSPYIRFGFAESTPANNVSATFLFEISINAKYTFNYHASQDGYLSLTSYVSNVSSSGMAITEDNSNMKRDAEYAENEINVLQKKEYSKYVSYSGQKISLEENPLKISDYISYTDTITFGTGVWCGGLAVYKNLAFVGIHSGIIAALDLNTLTLAAIGFSSQRSNNHMNNLSFDYDNLVGDYPLLYTSRCHAGNTECYVEKISVNLDCGVIKAELIQTITYSGDYLTETNAVDWALDVKNRKLMMINYDGETQNILFFDVPSTSESTVALTDADITSHYTYTVYPSQGSAIYNNKVYLLSGYANGGVLSVLDETTGNVINTIDLNTLMSTQEPEGACIYNNKVYVTTNPGNGLSFHLFALEFM